MRIIATLVLACLILFGSSDSSAQESTPTRKQQLIQELLSVTGARDNAGLLVDSILNEMSKQYPRIIEDLADANPKLTPAQREEIKSSAGERYARFSKVFRERLAERVDLGKAVEEISYPLYDKYFTEDELADLVSFYSTPTGKKTMSVLPQLLGESIQLAGEKLSPVLGSLIDEIMEEERKKIEGLR